LHALSVGVFGSVLVAMAMRVIKANAPVRRLHELIAATPMRRARNASSAAASPRYARSRTGNGDKLGLDATHERPGEIDRARGGPFERDARLRQGTDALWRTLFQPDPGQGQGQAQAATMIARPDAWQGGTRWPRSAAPQPPATCCRPTMQSPHGFFARLRPGSFFRPGRAVPVPCVCTGMRRWCR